MNDISSLFQVISMIFLVPRSTSLNNNSQQIGMHTALTPWAAAHPSVAESSGRVVMSRQRNSQEIPRGVWAVSATQSKERKPHCLLSESSAGTCLDRHWKPILCHPVPLDHQASATHSEFNSLWWHSSAMLQPSPTHTWPAAACRDLWTAPIIELWPFSCPSYCAASPASCPSFLGCFQTLPSHSLLHKSNDLRFEKVR